MSSSSADFDCDVVIVGGGPAGVSCAITVAQKGYIVVILDKKSRDKIGDKTCGDAIDRAALERLQDRIGLEFPSGDEISDPISKMSIAADEIDLKLTLDAPGFQLDRHIYGQRLLAEAEELGVKIISRAPVRGVITDTIDGEVFVSGVTYYHSGEEKKIRAKFTVDASGAYASVRKELPDELLGDEIKRELNDDELWPTYREIIKLNDNVAQHPWREEIVLMYDDDYPPPGYFWVFTKGEGFLNIGIGWEKTQDIGKLKTMMKNEMHKYYTEEQYEVVKRGGGQIPFRPPFDSLVFNGGALAGDAACMVHPVTAEGHGPALDTASHLGFTLIEALQSGKRDRDALWGYNVRVAHHYGKKHMEAHMMKRLLKEVGTKGLKYLIEKRIFKEEELNLIFAGGDIDQAITFGEKIKRGIKLLLKPKIMLGLYRLLTGTDTIDELYQQYPTSYEGLKDWRKLRNSTLNVNF